MLRYLSLALCFVLGSAALTRRRTRNKVAWRIAAS